ncbi:MAG: hypothetical protein P1V97_30055 [Planctomycetota bacterium]|nr:hypothetical protein [Planctomycetota bacterium]
MRRVLIALLFIFLSLSLCEARDDSVSIWSLPKTRDNDVKGLQRDLHTIPSPYEATEKSYLQDSNIDLELAENWHFSLNLVPTQDFHWNSDAALDYFHVVNLRDFDQVRFTGAHRLWVRQIRRFFKDGFRADREAYIDAGDHPALAARRYDELFAEQVYLSASEEWSLDRLWSDEPQSTARVFETHAPQLRLGALFMTDDFRVRVDADELPFRNRFSSPKPSRYSGESGRRELGGPEYHAVQKLRFSANLRFGGQYLARAISVRASAIITPFRTGKIVVPVSVSLRYDIDDQDASARVKILITSF